MVVVLLLFLAHAVAAADRAALLCVKSSLSDPAGALSSWRNDSSNFCRWPGVSCSAAGRVTAIAVVGRNLTGVLPPCISNLTALTFLDLSTNRIAGPVPPALGALPNLQALNLSVNSFSGVIPGELSSCSELQNLSLWRNSLSGEIPASFGRLSKLNTLTLSFNKLQGTIPESLAGNQQLSTLILTSNNLTGAIPASLGSNGVLSYVDLSENGFSGTIPPALANCSALQVLNLTHNSFSGELPPALLNNPSLLAVDFRSNEFSGEIPPITVASSPLLYLDLSANNLSGSIPPSIGKLSSVYYLVLNRNSFSGAIPAALAGIPGLQTLDLSINALSGTVPPAVYNMTTLQYLGLGNNQLAGTVPADIGITLPNLQNLVLQTNKLTGAIPASLARATSLTVIDLGDNQFTGVIPSFGSLPNLLVLNLGQNRLQSGDWSFLTALTNCTQLQRLYLNENNLDGALPSSIGKLSAQLQWLLLRRNRISGTIPTEISNLKGLQLLYMEQNELTGVIPAALGTLPNLFVLSLGRNRLSRAIPPSLGNLTQLSELYLQENSLNGSIPASLAGCSGLVVLNLSSNHLEGRIPPAIFSLTGLNQGLDMSFNRLSGPLPPEVGQLVNLGPFNVSGNQLSGEIPSALGQCVALEYLRMSANQFGGPIPDSLSNLKAIKELDLSQNQLTGAIPEFLASFTSLQLLNLSGNGFEGPVPAGGVFANASEVALQGNPGLCVTSSAPPLLGIPLCNGRKEDGGSSRVLKIVLPAVLIPLTALCLVLFLVDRKKRRMKKMPSSHSVKQWPHLLHADIVKATANFAPANFLGSGSFGSVYKGRLAGDVNKDEIVAIKVFDGDQHGAARSFMAECEALRNLRHRNLIGVITACSTTEPGGNDFRALVFEYMPNGNLDTLLHHPATSKLRPLTLKQRISIAKDIAAALDYLHNESGARLVHCDLKPSNVLLNSDMTAKVGDFGLARFLLPADEHHGSTSMAALQGSIGYIAPEYGMAAKISTEGDMYSFGILLLELLTGKRPTDEAFRDGLSLRKLVEAALSADDAVGVVDRQAWGDEDGGKQRWVMESCVSPLLKLGLLCSSEQPRDRPGAHDALAKISEAMDELAMIEASRPLKLPQ